MTFERRRIIVGKIGLDSHDNGLRIISKWLMDGGYEVIYAGLYNNTQRIVQMAIEENPDAVGISFLGGEHLFYTKQLIKELQQKDMGNVKVIIGGVIPPDDVKELKTIGADAVFTPGTPKQKILDVIESLFT
ncbi:MAG: cobalamin-dependent protein [Thermodesulfobacteriota bacterium]|jgi:methylmalonyl-CoA mutase C-terminal domain/subunit